MVNVKRRRSFGIDDDEDESSNGVVERRRCWSDLPSDLLEIISSKLFFSDQINFSAVCKSWHSVVRVPPLKQLPWLMVFDYKIGKQSWVSCKLVDPTYKKTYTIDMSSINKKKNLKDCKEVKIHESKYGWLLMSCILNENLTSGIHSLFLYCPFSTNNNIIELPVLSASDTHKYIATFDFINPSNKKEEEADFEVLILSLVMNDGSICIKTCRGGNNSWNCNKQISNFHFESIMCWVYSEGIFYYMDYSRESGSYDIVRNNWTKFPALVPVQPFNYLYMTKFDGEIYLISTNKNDESWGLISVYIYKFNLSKGTWESTQLHDLDDRVLFVGDGYSSILELDNDIEELKDQKQKVYYCYTAYVGGSYYATILKYCNALNGNESHFCSEWYGSLAQGNRDCKRLWIDPPRRIRNTYTGADS